MEIQWFGQACFRVITTKNKQDFVRIVIDPFSEEIGIKLPFLEAEILLVSHNHYDHNNIAQVRGDPFLIQEPGEYEVKDVFIQAIPSFHDNSQGEERGDNLIFTIESENLGICHLGDLGQKRLTDEQLEKIGDVDILMIPIGGIYTINGKEAQDIIAQIEPRLIIPMHYSLPSLKVKLEGVEKFLKVMGQKAETQRKLKIQKKDLIKEEMEIILLEVSRQRK